MCAQRKVQSSVPGSHTRDTHFDESEDSLGQDRRPWAGGEGKRRKKEGQCTCTRGSGEPKALSVPGRRTSPPRVVLPLAQALSCTRASPQHGSACGAQRENTQLKTRISKLFKIIDMRGVLEQPRHEETAVRTP